MKKIIYTLFILIAIATKSYAVNPVPNGDFETWNSATFSYPANYSYTPLADKNAKAFVENQTLFNITKITNSKSGSYAVQLKTVAIGTDTTFGYFSNANPSKDPSLWTGGIPYTQKPTGISGYYEYNVATADSGTIIVAFSKLGNNIGTYIYRIGGIKNSYTPFNFTFNPALSQTPDSVIFAAASSNTNGNGKAGSILTIDDIAFTGVASQPSLLNGDFESWQDTTIYSLASWNDNNNNGKGIIRTTDVVSGNYAVELKTFLGNDNNQKVARQGSISTGYYLNNCNGNCVEQGGYPFTNRKDTLTFYYKYVPSGNDSAQINLNFKKNGTFFQGAGASLYATGNSYQYMEIPFQLNQIPDSMIVDIQSSNWQNTALSFVGSDLKIDNIQLKSHPLSTGVISPKNDNTISFYPNPAVDFFTLNINNTDNETAQLNIYNVAGSLVKSINITENQQVISTSNLSPGIYIVTVKLKDTTIEKKLIIQR
jgi:hypothetical protein